MKWVSSNSTFLMERSMRFLWTKQSAILDNLANVETPGYKAKYVTFEEELSERISSAARGQAVGASIRQAIESAKVQKHTAVDETTRLDENGVNATEQSVELSRNAIQYQYTIQAMTSDFATLRTAIRGQ